jgi:hypothetical protein
VRTPRFSSAVTRIARDDWCSHWMILESASASLAWSSPFMILGAGFNTFSSARAI